MTLTVSPARPQDLTPIFATMRANAHDPSLFQQRRTAVARQLGEFLVARSTSSDADVLGCLQVHRHPGGSVEILAVAVRPDQQGRGVGSALMRAAVARARELTESRIWLGTAKPGYFARLGFVRMSRWRLPLVVLVGKLPKVAQQPLARWLPSIFGRHVFMCLPTDESETALEGSTRATWTTSTSSSSGPSARSRRPWSSWRGP